MIAEFIVRERNDKLRNLLNIMGCSYSAYWVGSFIADYLLMSVTLGVMFISWGAADMPHFYSSRDGLNFFVWMLFVFELICFAYASSFMFKSPKSCIWTMPVFVIITLISPNIILLIGIQIAKAAGASVNETDQSKKYIFVFAFLILSVLLLFLGSFCFWFLPFLFCVFLFPLFFLFFRSWYSSLGHSHSFTVWCNLCLHFKHYQ
jgi:hypothetical protein